MLKIQKEIIGMDYFKCLWHCWVFLFFPTFYCFISKLKYLYISSNYIYVYYQERKSHFTKVARINIFILEYLKWYSRCSRSYWPNGGLPTSSLPLMSEDLLKTWLRNISKSFMITWEWRNTDLYPLLPYHCLKTSLGSKHHQAYTMNLLPVCHTFWLSFFETLT